MGTARPFGVIPARGGSKGIPRKNIRLFAGKPLIAWTILAALNARSLAGVVVSTDDQEIADLSRELGAAVPFLRPAALARDDTPGVEPILHMLGKHPAWQAVMVLQPTSPLRTSEDIDNCMALVNSVGAVSAASVFSPPTHPYWMYRINPNGRMLALIDAPAVANRQDLPPVYAMNGALYYADASWLQAKRTFVTDETIAFMMPGERSVDIDTAEEWRFAEQLLLERER